MITLPVTIVVCCYCNFALAITNIIILIVNNCYYYITLIIVNHNCNQCFSFLLCLLEVPPFFAVNSKRAVNSLSAGNPATLPGYLWGSMAAAYATRPVCSEYLESQVTQNQGLPHHGSLKVAPNYNRPLAFQLAFGSVRRFFKCDLGRELTSFGRFERTSIDVRGFGGHAICR